MNENLNGKATIAQSGSAKKIILMVEDDTDFAAANRMVLEAKNYVVYHALNIEEAIGKIEQVRPDLIITDVMMKKMCDGFDFSRKLKSDEKYKNIPILMLTSVSQVTGFNYSPDKGDELWLPVDCFMNKPVSPEGLILKVEELLSLKPK